MGPCQTQIILAERLCNVNSFEAEPPLPSRKQARFGTAGVRGEK